jgi:quercetin dioxygenase-like cupin family protein
MPRRGVGIPAQAAGARHRSFALLLGRSSIDCKREKRETKKMKMILILSCLITGVLVAQKSKVAPLMSKDVTGCPGKEVTMITVEYAPGESDVIHRHNAQVFVYVLEGKVVMQVKGGEPLTLGPGQTFYEGPKDIHLVSRNASGTESSKFLVFFMKDKGAPLLIPAK